MTAALEIVALLLFTAMIVMHTAGQRAAWKLHDAATAAVVLLAGCSLALALAAAIGAPS